VVWHVTPCEWAGLGRVSLVPSLLVPPQLRTRKLLFQFPSQFHPIHPILSPTFESILALECPHRLLTSGKLARCNRILALTLTLIRITTRLTRTTTPQRPPRIINRPPPLLVLHIPQPIPPRLIHLQITPRTTPPTHHTHLPRTVPLGSRPVLPSLGNRILAPLMLMPVVRPSLISLLIRRISRVVERDGAAVRAPVFGDILQDPLGGLACGRHGACEGGQVEVVAPGRVADTTAVLLQHTPVVIGDYIATVAERPLGAVGRVEAAVDPRHEVQDQHGDFNREVDAVEGAFAEIPGMFRVEYRRQPGDGGAPCGAEGEEAGC